ncbi:fibroblast growth factor-binding protein 1-like [Salarias fasciatus]|uniref:fibroblast growth factor-binding protein 1-like n=1 Tax=Salarias fasciatus TaxID=181472 RepID=UPI001176B838|nr:fibroblast growth factor-binding protein 1-like [Salarias fasciatus]
MMLLRSFAPWLLLAFLAQQVSSSWTGRGSKNASSSPGRLPNGVVGKGKFTNNKMLCLWHAVDVSNATRIEIGCDPGAFNKSGLFALQCSYVGKPQKCSMYKSNPEAFWKRVARRLKKIQVKLCKDERAQVQAASCGRSQRDAHFKLDPKSTRIFGPPSGSHIPQPRPTRFPAPVPTLARPTNCTSREERLKTAEEYCSSDWASVCSFFLSLLQSDGC